MADRTRIRGARAAFVCYAAALFAATHWPRLELPPGPLPRPDLFVHAGVFAVWTILLGLTGWVRGVGPLVVVGAMYAGVDEALQAIPAVHRHAAWADFAANLAGVALGAAAVAIAGRRRAARTRAAPAPKPGPATGARMLDQP